MEETEELEIGEYVRTKDGCIGSYVSILDDIIEFNISDNKSKEYTPLFTYYSNIKKHSFNIIDLIEVGDYVNGYKVIEKTKIENEEMQICIYKDNTCSCWRTINNITLKSIVTKEQFAESEYKVNENL